MAKRRGNQEGSIWKGRKRWRAAVSIDGKRITRSFDTKAECKAWIHDTHNQVKLGMTYKASSLTFGEFLENWIGIHKTKLSVKTAVRYQQLIRDYIAPQLGDIKFRDLTLDRIEVHYQSLYSKGLSSRSVRFVHSIIHRSINDAVRKGYIAYNPSHGATLPRPDYQEMKFLDEDEVIRFMIAIQGSRHEALYHLAIKTGMRKGELLGLKWSDLDWRRGTIHVRRQVQRVHKKGLIVKPPKSKTGRRTIKLGRITLDVLEIHHKQQQLAKQKAGDRWKEMNLIFPSTIGTYLGGSNILKDFKDQLKKANVKQIRFHDLRHTAATLLLNNGVPVLVVSKILGHSKTSTTLDIYGHLITSMQGEAAQLMDNLVTPIRVNMGEKMDLQNVKSS